MTNPLFFKASRCLRELEVPHFHHELIYEVIFCFFCFNHHTNG